MKNFIKSQLHILLEQANNYATEYDYTKTQEKIRKVKELYGGDPYFESIESGNWVGHAIVNIHGDVSITRSKHRASDVQANQLGIAKENPNYLQFTLKAGRGVEHPDTYEKELNPSITKNRKYDSNFDNNDVEVASPASDAQVKTYLIFGEEILNFIEKNMRGGGMGYLDGKGEELAKQTPEKNVYKFDKKNQEMDRLERAREKKRQEMNRRDNQL